MDIAKKKKASIRSGKKKAGPGYKTKIKMKKAKSDYYDFNLVAVIILIMCFGLIMLYSTSSYMAQINEGDDMFYFKKQAMYSIGCLVLAIIVSYFDYHILAKFPFVIYVAAAVLMVLVKTPLGVTSHGARRWLKLGVQFQPAEIAKIAVIITLSYLIVKMGKRVETLKATMVLLGMGGIQALFAYVFTDNLSTVMIIFGITVGLVFIAHPRTKPFVIVGLVVVVLLAMVANIFLQMPVLHLVISAAVVLLFSGYILYDISNIVQGGETNYVTATLAVYLDVYNVFVSLLNLIMAFGGDRD